MPLQSLKYGLRGSEKWSVIHQQSQSPRALSSRSRVIGSPLLGLLVILDNLINDSLPKCSESGYVGMNDKLVVSEIVTKEYLDLGVWVGIRTNSYVDS